MTKTILAIGAALALAACTTSTPAPTTYDVPPVPPPAAYEPAPPPAGPSSSSIHHGAFTFEVQHRLKALGYYEGEVDGANGPMTRATVRHFQHDNHLHETGVVDQHTDSALRLSAGH